MVAGEGPQPAKGMIVGEAPGKKETEAGRPFVGPSGRLLDSVLNALGVRRDECYITNVVKEWPLDSDGRTRAPYQEEIDAWLPILEGEIEHTAPVAILSLGRPATNALIPLSDPDDWNVIPFGSKVGNIYTAWHPAFLLHTGRHPERMEEWLEQVRPWAEALGKYEYPS